ncbi:SMI1/KNR4 family protein [Nocardia brasiliensis]
MDNLDHLPMTERIHAAFQDVVAYGLRPEAVSGATDAQIDDMAAAQGAPAVPTAVREVLRLIGDDQGPFLSGGCFFGVDEMREDVKETALEFYDMASPRPAEFRAPADMLVLLFHGGYQVCVIDGADLNDPNPPVWLLEEDGELSRLWSTVTEWFAGVCAGVKSLADLLADMRAQNQPEVAWARHFRGGGAS